MIRVGTAGWSYPDWEGVVYPRHKPRGFHPLRHLARFVDCVEINSSFYALPEERSAERWLTCVADRPDFRFTAKLWRAFTHEALPEGDAELERLAAAFLERIEALRGAGRLAALLVQFPLSFHWSADAERRLARLEACFGHLPLVLEVRHRGWFEREPLAAVERLGYSLAEIDLPASDRHPPPDPPTIGPLRYLRLHGRNAATWFARGVGRDQRYDYLYGAEELAEITGRIRRQGPESFVVTNNHFAGQALANALEILAALRHDVPDAPAELVAAYPRLAGVVRAVGQQALF